MIQLTRDNVLVFKALLDEYLHAQGQPMCSLGEAMLAFDRAAKAAAEDITARRERRATNGGFDAMKRPGVERRIY